MTMKTEKNKNLSFALDMKIPEFFSTITVNSIFQTIECNVRSLIEAFKKTNSRCHFETSKTKIRFISWWKMMLQKTIIMIQDTIQSVEIFNQIWKKKWVNIVLNLDLHQLIHRHIHQVVQHISILNFEPVKRTILRYQDSFQYQNHQARVFYNNSHLHRRRMDMDHHQHGNIQCHNLVSHWSMWSQRHRLKYKDRGVLKL